MWSLIVKEFACACQSGTADSQWMYLKLSFEICKSKHVAVASTPMSLTLPNKAQVANYLTTSTVYISHALYNALTKSNKMGVTTTRSRRYVPSGG